MSKLNTISKIIAASLWVVCLSFLSWNLFIFFYFISFLPFFWLFENKEFNFKTKLAGALSMLLCWNISVTYWLCEVNFWYGVSAITANSILMLVAISIIYFFLLRFIAQKLKFLFFLFGWLLFEYAHHFWDLSWTWLTIGNVFGTSTYLVQWFEFTGVLGGTAWVLIVNYLIYKTCRASFTMKKVVGVGAVIVLPILFSLLLRSQNLPLKGHISVVFTRTEFPVEKSFTDENRIWSVSGVLSTQEEYDVLLLPELFLNDAIWYVPNVAASMKMKFAPLIKDKENVRIIAGAVMYKENQKSGTHKAAGNYLIKYDAYNTAILISGSGETVKLKAKKVYVPVEEFVPLFLSWIPFATENYSRLNTPETFSLPCGDMFVSLCYESINSFFISDYIGNSGAIMMLASEAFFKGSKTGKQQYASICSLRSIENRKAIVKSSNCGTAFYCDYKGTFKFYLSEKTNVAKKVSVPLNNNKTVYNHISKYMGYILAACLTGFYLTGLVFRRQKNCSI